VGLAIIKRKPYAVWAIPLAGLLLLLEIGALGGSITLKARYAFLAGVLSLPFLAGLFEMDWVARMTQRRRRALTVLLLASIVPLAYIGNLGPEMLATYYWKNINPLPRVGEAARETSGCVNRSLQGPTDGLILDFFGWAETYYVALAARVHPDRIHIVSGARNEGVDRRALDELLRKYPTGVIVLNGNQRLGEGARYERVAACD